MTAKYNLETYLKYYAFVTQTSPVQFVEGGYDTAISSMIKVLPSKFRLHTTGENPIEIVSYKSAKQLWEMAIKEVEHNPVLSDNDRRSDTDYPGFFREDEFVPPLTVGKLCKVITTDYGNVPIQEPVNTIAWLNKLLEIVNLYEILYVKKPDNIFARRDKYAKNKGHTVVCAAECYRDKLFSRLNQDEQVELKKFNRYALEFFYPYDAPRTPDVYSRAGKRQWEMERKRVELYLTAEHKANLEKLEQNEQNTPASAMPNPTEQATPGTRNTEGKPQDKPAGATANNTQLCFTYNKKSRNTLVL